MRALVKGLLTGESGDEEVGSWEVVFLLGSMGAIDCVERMSMPFIASQLESE